MPEDDKQPAAPPPPASQPGGAPPTRGFGYWVGRAVLALGVVATLGVMAVSGLFFYYSRDLPTFDNVTDYRPPQVSRVYDRAGAPVAEFFHERRTVVPREKIPLVLKQAAVAAEDNHFYEHKGLDYLGIARAVFSDLRQMKLAQGASTITQQVVKNMVLSPERSLARKVKEAILAGRIERNLTKDEILALYLNHIYFGHHRYGVEEASRFYFNKGVQDLSLGEAAMLAGIPQSPAKLSPLRNPDKAKVRQTYVLNQMAENGFITRAQADAEIARPIPVAPSSFEPVGPYYAEEVRKQLVERYGEQVVYEGGLRIDVAMDRRMQQLCDDALRNGLAALDHRFGYKPPELSVAPAVLAAARPGLLTVLDKPLPSRDRGSEQFVAWDFIHVSAQEAAAAESLEKAVEPKGLGRDEVLVAPVAKVEDGEARVDLGKYEGVLPFEQMKWARPYAPGKWSAPPKSAKDILAPNQLVRVRVLDLPKPEVEASEPADKAKGKGKAAKAEKPPEKAADKQPAKLVVPLALEQVPEVQGALVSVDPATRQVVALAGGYDFAASAFNRATQAKRQPGSAFKPFVYAAALQSGKFTAASILNDAPELIRDPYTGKEWKPQNFEKDVYEGPMMLRQALAASKNTISVRLIEALGAPPVIDLARRAGITSPLPETLTLALGTAEVSPLELANAYATFAALGKRAEPLLITRVTDAGGKVLEEHAASAEETMPPAVAYVTTSLMQSVVDYGTATRAKELNRPVAGKTGTASEHRDAWFAGFTPDLVAVAWVGFDDHSKLGGSETGGHAALPMWLEFMKGALEGKPRVDFVKPPGVEEVKIDPATGLRAAADAPGRSEYFLEGSAPQETAVRPGEANPDLLFLEDGGRGR